MSRFRCRPLFTAAKLILQDWHVDSTRLLKSPRRRGVYWLPMMCWKGPLMNRATPPLKVTGAQRSTLLALTRSTSAPHRQVVRARALLLAADGVANDRIAAELGLSATTVRSWRVRFQTDGLAQLGRVRPGQGPKPTIPAATVEAIVHATSHSKPKGHPHWSCQTMAEEFGVSAATVHRIWHARGVNPRLAAALQLSNDPPF